MSEFKGEYRVPVKREVEFTHVADLPGRLRNATCPCGTAPAHKVKRCPSRLAAQRAAERENAARAESRRRRALLDAGELERVRSHPPTAALLALALAGGR